MGSRKTDSPVISLPQPALTLAASSADQVYARAFDFFFVLPGDVLKIQLMHYLPESSYGNRDWLGWTLSGALIGLLAHWIGGEHAQTLQQTRELGVRGAMPVLQQMLETWDALILAHTTTAGWQLVHSEPVAGRVAWWELHDGQKFEQWLAAAKTAARIQRTQEPKPPLNDPLFREAASIIIDELKVMLKQLRSQSLAGQKPPDLVQFFADQSDRGEFRFLSDEHTLHLWLDFVASKSGQSAFLVYENKAGNIFDAFQKFVSGHKFDYVRQMRSRG